MQSLLLNDNTNLWKHLLITAIFSRIVILILTFFIPIPFGPEPPISPLHYQQGVDLAAYIDAIPYFSSFVGLREMGLIYYEMIFLGVYPEVRPPGPIYSWFLMGLRYSTENTVALSITIFVMESLTIFIWFNILKKQINLFSGLLLAFMPHSIWFGLLISSDIFIYFFSSLYFYIVLNQPSRFYKFVPLLCLLMVLSKPTGIVFCLGSLFLSKDYFKNNSEYFFSMFLMILILFFSIIYYLPYFLVEQNVIASNSELKEISHAGTSVIKNIVKFFYVFGFHPSESNLFFAEIIRYFYGFFFVLGFFLSLNFNKTFAIIIIPSILMLVLFLVPSWRYILPFLPLFIVLSSNFFVKQLFKINMQR